MICDFCEKESIASNIFFAGDHSPPTGPFALCEDCLSFQTDCNGWPLYDDVAIFDKEAYDRAVFEYHNMEIKNDQS